MTKTDIEKLESELSFVRKISDRDAESLEASDDPSIDRIFYASSEKRRLDLEKLLHRAKSERAHELISIRLIGNQMTGSIRLKSLVKIVGPLNSLLEYSAWRFWDKEGREDRMDESFSNLIDLRLAGIENGSTELVVVGNTSPDLTGDSALEEGLKNIFGMLASDNEEFGDHIHGVGLPACKSLSKLMTVLEKSNIATEFMWSGPSKSYTWEGSPSEVTRIRAILDDIGEPEKETIHFLGIVQVLSIRNRIEVFRLDTEEKIVVNYHRSLSDEINQLHLGEKKDFMVEKTVYPFRIAQKKKDAYSLVTLSDGVSKLKSN